MKSPRPTMKGFPWLLAIAFLVLPIAGCGKSTPKGTVKGKVLLENQPYSDARVALLSLQSGQASSADIRPDGTFQLNEPLPVGKYTVFLAAKSSPEGGNEAAPKPEAIDRAVPDKYWSEATSDVSVEIKAGENDVTVPLKK